MLTDPDGDMVGCEGKGLTVTEVVPEGTLWHPLAFVTCTVKLPLVVTVMLRVVAPVDQR